MPTILNADVRQSAALTETAFQSSRPITRNNVRQVVAALRHVVGLGWDKETPPVGEIRRFGVVVQACLRRVRAAMMSRLGGRFDAGACPAFTDHCLRGSGSFMSKRALPKVVFYGRS